jgi:hypothetical protein
MKRSYVPWAILIAAALVYPLAVVATGAPSFPSRAECVHPATTDGSIDAVFGRYRARTAAEAELRHVLGLGFDGSQIESDGCGLLKVVVHGIPTLATGRAFLQEAARAGVHASLEQSDG